MTPRENVVYLRKRGRIDQGKARATALTAPGCGRTGLEFDVSDVSAERWLPVVGFEGIYEVSSIGRVRSLDRTIRRGGGYWPTRIQGQLLNPVAINGYRRVNLGRPGHQELAWVHRLVCKAFYGEPGPGQEVRHLNGVPGDNRLENLAWGSRSENAQDRLRHGTNPNAAKTYCVNGHEFTKDNIYRRPGKVARNCRECGRARQRKTGITPAVAAWVRAWSESSYRDEVISASTYALIVWPEAVSTSPRNRFGTAGPINRTAGKSLARLGRLGLATKHGGARNNRWSLTEQAKQLLESDVDPAFLGAS